MTKTAANSNHPGSKGAKPAAGKATETRAGAAKPGPAEKARPAVPEKPDDAGSKIAGLSAVEHQRIKHRAHALWREEGSPQGRDREFWERAELQVLKGGVAT